MAHVRRQIPALAGAIFRTNVVDMIEVVPEEVSSRRVEHDPKRREVDGVRHLNMSEFGTRESELGTYKTVKARFWSYLQPFSVKRCWNIM